MAQLKQERKNIRPLEPLGSSRKNRPEYLDVPRTQSPVFVASANHVRVRVWQNIDSRGTIFYGVDAIRIAYSGQPGRSFHRDDLLDLVRALISARRWIVKKQSWNPFKFLWPV